MRHLFIPDTQIREGVPISHIEALGNYIEEKRFDKIIVAGDWWDCPATSNWNTAREQEGLRVIDDIQSGKKGMNLLWKAVNKRNKKVAGWKKRQYTPEKHFLMGNHEKHLERLWESDPRLVGLIDYSVFGIEEHGFQVHDFLDPVRIDGILYCLAPHHSVLTSNLEYVELGNLRIGDKLVAFDEYPQNGRHGRRYREATVEKHDFDRAELFKVSLSDGTVFEATADHKWLVREFGTGISWKRTDELRVGITKPIRLFPTWETINTYDAGWLAGMFDGEGHLSKPNSNQGGIQVGIAQRENSAYFRLLDILCHLGVKHKSYGCGGTNGDVQSIRILGPSARKLQLLGSIRAQRLIDKFDPKMLGRVQKMDGDESVFVTDITPNGVGDIVKIQTSTGTMIVDGFAHHNCHYFANPNNGRPYSGMIETRLKNIASSFTQGHAQSFAYGEREVPGGKRHHGLVAGAFYQHDEPYKGPYGNHHWRGVVVKNDVRDGEYDIMKISLDYLLRRYL